MQATFLLSHPSVSRVARVARVAREEEKKRGKNHDGFSLFLLPLFALVACADDVPAAASGTISSVAEVFATDASSLEFSSGAPATDTNGDAISIADFAETSNALVQFSVIDHSGGEDFLAAVNDANNEIEISSSAQAQAPALGTYTLTIQALDAATNSTALTTITYVYDNDEQVTTSQSEALVWSLSSTGETHSQSFGGFFEGGNGALVYSVSPSQNITLDTSALTLKVDSNDFGVGEHSFALTATDSDGDKEQVAITLNIYDQSVPSVASNATTSFSQTRAETSVDIALSSLFLGGNGALTYALSNDSGGASGPIFSLNTAGTDIVVNKSLLAEGANTVTVVVTDADNDPASVVVTVSLTDLLPVAESNATTSFSQTRAETPVDIALSGLFSGGDGALTYALSNDSGGASGAIFSLNTAGTDIVVTKSLLAEGNNTVTVVVTDADNDPASVVVTVSLTDLLPVAVSNATTSFSQTQADTPVDIALSGLFSGGDGALTYALSNDSGGASGAVFSLNTTGTHLVVNESLLALGSNTVEVIASDADGDKTTPVVVTLFLIHSETVQLSAVTDGQGAMLESTASSLGIVSDIGDINNDGYADILLGAEGQNKAYLLYGKAGKDFGTPSQDIRTTDLDNMAETDGFVLSGSGSFGRGVNLGGDVNGDGIGDIIIGTKDNSGTAHLIWGKEGTRGDINVQSLSANEGVMLMGDDGGDHFGWAVNIAGDINNDGYDDIVVGERFANSSNGLGSAGKAYVIWGKNSTDYGTLVGTGTGASRTLDVSDLTKEEGFHIESNGSSDYLGFSLDATADFNGDGLEDLVIGVYCDSDAHTWAGEVLLLWGRDEDIAYGEVNDRNGIMQRTLDVDDLRVNDGLSIKGDDKFDKFGISVSAVGDLNGDGFADILAGSQGNDDGGTQAKSGFTNGSGVAYVIWGRAITASSNSADPLATIDTSSLAPSDGFVIEGVGNTTKLGESTAAAGDLNNDGYDDIIIGAPGDTGGANLDANGAGAAYIIWGQASKEYGTLEANDDSGDGFMRRMIHADELPIANGFSIVGDQSGRGLGKSVAGGDINNDGYSDVVIGSGSGDSVILFGDAFLPASFVPPEQSWEPPASGPAEGGGGVEGLGEMPPPIDDVLPPSYGGGDDGFLL